MVADIRAHQEMMFKPFGVCLRETNLIQAEKNYNADVCPYKDKRKDVRGNETVIGRRNQSNYK